MMKPLQAPLVGQKPIEDAPVAASLHLTTLTKRADFLHASKAARIAMPGFIVQMRRRANDDAEGIRVGFTCSKKVGNAVARNRAKRRLREIARLTLPEHGCQGVDYVLIGRAGMTAGLPFEILLRDLQAALAKLHGRRN